MSDAKILSPEELVRGAAKIFQENEALRAEVERLGRERAEQDAVILEHNDELCEMQNEIDEWQDRAIHAEEYLKDTTTGGGAADQEIKRLTIQNAALAARVEELTKERDGWERNARIASSAQVGEAILREKAERDELTKAAEELLAVVFRDGGQHSAAVGLLPALEQAQERVFSLLAARDVLDESIREVAVERARSAGLVEVLKGVALWTKGDARGCGLGLYRMASEALAAYESSKSDE